MILAFLGTCTKCQIISSKTRDLKTKIKLFYLHDHKLQEIFQFTRKDQDLYCTKPKILPYNYLYEQDSQEKCNFDNKCVILAENFLGMQTFSYKSCIW